MLQSPCPAVCQLHLEQVRPKSSHSWPSQGHQLSSWTCPPVALGFQSRCSHYGSNISRYSRLNLIDNLTSHQTKPNPVTTHPLVLNFSTSSMGLLPPIKRICLKELESGSRLSFIYLASVRNVNVLLYSYETHLNWENSSRNWPTTSLIWIASSRVGVMIKAPTFKSGTSNESKQRRRKQTFVQLWLNKHKCIVLTLNSQLWS